MATSETLWGKEGRARAEARVVALTGAKEAEQHTEAIRALVGAARRMRARQPRAPLPPRSSSSQPFRLQASARRHARRAMRASGHCEWQRAQTAT